MDGFEIEKRGRLHSKGDRLPLLSCRRLHSQLDSAPHYYFPSDPSCPEAAHLAHLAQKLSLPWSRCSVFLSELLTPRSRAVRSRKPSQTQTGGVSELVRTPGPQLSKPQPNGINRADSLRVLPRPWPAILGDNHTLESAINGS